ncbi:MAG: N-acetylglucosamine kinase [Chitinophagaceae bacterium]|nr:N-acetylglucosamine kinase [Chitinophagaceae bacterium]MCW5905902.1 N-acetylglucosamine kinase [Chitinophagaceae bacterium]
MATLIADCGATKCEWRIISNNKKKSFFTQGISPYFLGKEAIILLLQKELLPKIKNTLVTEIFFYGTGLSNPSNVKLLKQVLQQLFGKIYIEVNTDMLAAARALCGNQKGIVSILGTGSNSCYYNGNKIVKNNAALGFILGDEGSGAYLGKKVIQYYLYQTFDEELMMNFNKTYQTDKNSILNAVYKSPTPNSYLAGFAKFLADNRGHYMVENIIEDGLNDFFLNHIYKYRESWIYPIYFSGGIAYAFKDVLQELCLSYELEIGAILKSPMNGLIKYHQ